MDNYKLQKYRSKFDNSQDQSKKNSYDNKLKYYSNVTSKNPRDNLLKPVPVTDLSNYKLNLENNNPGKPVLAFGYGTMSEKSKNVPVIFERRALGNNDVMFEIYYEGVCHSDWHTILNEWKNSKYPVVAGHEMTGVVIQIGPGVKNFQVGNKVALSPLYNSCRKCNNCKKGEEQYCENGTTETYNQQDRLPTDKKEPTCSVTYGGYSNIMVVDEYFLFKFPDNLAMDRGAPLLCAGLTVYNAILDLKIKPGELLGVAGIGGLGSILIKMCKVMGIRTIALTTTEWKLDDAKKLGAEKSILMKDMTTLGLIENKLDYIIDTIPFKHDLDPYLKLLKIHGTICVVGAFFNMNPDFNEIIRRGKKIQGSNTAGTVVANIFLEFCSKHNILQDIELIKFDQLNDTHDKLVKSQCRYRYVIDVKSSMKSLS